MNYKPYSILFVFFLIFFGGAHQTNAQFLKKLKEKLEDKVVQKVGQKADEAVGKGSSRPSIEQEKTENKPPTISEESSPSSEQKTLKKDSQSNLLVYESPSEHFVDIVLQSHNGFPKFGILDSYKLPLGSPASISSETIEKNNLINNSYYNYSNLLVFKYSGDLMKELDSENPSYITTSTGDQKEQNRAIATKVIQDVIPSICASDECKLAYSGMNEFEQRRYYKTFIEEVLPELSHWSKSFFLEDSQEVYYVDMLFLTKGYDYEKKGFWTAISLEVPLYGKKTRGKSLNFEPKESYELELKNHVDSHRSTIQVFVPMDEQTAENLFKKRAPLYLLRKIILSPSSTYDEKIKEFQFVYHHENPTVEIFEDSALQNKVVTLSLDKLTFSN